MTSLCWKLKSNSTENNSYITCSTPVSSESLRTCAYVSVIFKVRVASSIVRTWKSWAGILYYEKKKKPFVTFGFLVFKNYKVDTFSLNRMYTMIMRKKNSLSLFAVTIATGPFADRQKKNEKVKNRRAKAAFWTTNRFLFKPPL